MEPNLFQIGRNFRIHTFKDKLNPVKMSFWIYAPTNYVIPALSDGEIYMDDPISIEFDQTFEGLC